MIINENPLISNSLWTSTANLKPTFDTLSGSEEFEVTIIGGGLSGVSTLYHCLLKGINACLVETNVIGWGASGRNGGQVNPGLKELPETIIAHFGDVMGRRIIELCGGAPDYLFKLIEDNNIDCSSEQNGWIQASNNNRGFKMNEEAFRQWTDYDAPVNLLSQSEVEGLIGSENYVAGFLDRRGGKIHPLNYVVGLAFAAQKSGGVIYENAPVTKINQTKSGYQILCGNNEIKSEKIVLATNGYGNSTSGTSNKNVIPVQSIQVSTAPLSDNLLGTILPNGHVVSDTQRLLKYFRIAENGRLLMGGRGGTSNLTTNQQILELKNFIVKMFPNLRDISFEYCWGGNVALTLNHYPQICELSKGMISLSGYNGRGNAMTTVLGKVVADKLSGLEDKDLDFPVTKHESVPFGKLHQVVLPLAMGYNRVLDKYRI